MQLKSLGSLQIAKDAITQNADDFNIVSDAVKNLSKEYKMTALASSTLSEAQKTQILINQGLTVEEAKQAIATATLSASEKEATGTTLGLSTAFKGLATSLGISTTALGTLTASIAVFAAGLVAFRIYKQHIEDVCQATEEAANTYSEATDSISHYVEKYQELRESLIAANGNEEETYNVKRQLLDLQTELNNKFGEESGTLNLVTDAYKDQTEAIKAYNKEAAQTYLNENSEGIKRATNEMTREDRHYNLSSTGISSFTDEGAVLKEIAEKYKDQGITLLDELGDGSYAQFSVHLETDAQSAYDTINNYENDLREKAKELGDEHMFDDALEISSSELNNAKEIIDNYGNQFKESLIAEITSDDNKAKTYTEALQAIEEYNEAVLKSENPYNDENVTKAKANLDTIKASIQGNETEWGKYSYVMDDIFDQVDSRLLDFDEALQSDDNLQKLANDLEGLTNLDLQSLDENVGENASFDKLKESAAKCGISVEELIDALVRLGYVQGEIASETVNEVHSIPSTISSSISQLATQLEPQFAKLGEAYKAIFTDDGFTLDDVDNSMLEGLRQSFAEIEKEVGVAFDTTQLDSFFDALTTDYDNTEDGAKSVQQAFNDLATAYFYSTDTLEQLNSETVDAIEKQLEEMGVVNAQAVVADALAAKTEELLIQKQYLAETGKELSSVTEEEQFQYIASEIAAGNYSKSLAILQMQKILCNENWINSTTDINALLTLANAAGITSDALGKLYNLKAQYDAADNPHAKADIAAQMEALKSTIQADITNVQIDFGNIGGTKSAASSAGSVAGASYVDAFEEELNRLQDLRDRGVIDESTYLKQLRALYQRYFANRKEYIDEYNKYEKQYLEGMKSLYDSALSGISTLMSHKIDAATNAKESCIASLEAEKDAAAEAYQTQIDSIEDQKDAIDDLIDQKNKQIDAINDEIDKIKEASEARKRNLDLQKAQYELERMQNQRTILQYSEDKGMHYVQDTSGVRDAKEKVTEIQEEMRIAELEKQISLIENEIDLLEIQKDSLNQQQDSLQKMMDESNKYYEKLITEQETYWDSMIQNMEQQKSKWEELADIQEIADAYSKIQMVFGELGYSVDDVLNGSESAFEDFKSKYIALISDMNNNSNFADGLSYATGIAKETLGSFLDKTQETADRLQPIDDAISEIDTNMSNLATSSGNATIGTGAVSSNLGEIKTNTEGLPENLNGINDALNNIPDAASKIDIIAQSYDTFGKSINNEEGTGLTTSLDEINGRLNEVPDANTKVDSIASAYDSLNKAVTNDEGINLSDKLTEINSALGDIPESSKFVALAAAFTILGEAIKSVADALGISGEETVCALTQALQNIGELSLGTEEDGIIAQFQKLKASVNDVSNAISGEGSESSGGKSQGGNSGSAKGGESGSKGSGGGGSSLTSAITKMGETASEVIGEPEAEGDGTVIGEFGSLKTAVNNVTSAIGNGDSNGDESKDNISKGKDDGNLIGSITDLGNQTKEVLGEPGGEGVIGRFEQFEQPIGEADQHVKSIFEGLNDIDGKEVECTITVNVNEVGGSHYAKGTVLGSMNLNNSAYQAQYGQAFSSGYNGLPKAEKNALRSEYGQPELTVYPNGITELTTRPTMSDLPKGTVIFNEEQTKKILREKSKGKAFANGTANNRPILSTEGALLPLVLDDNPIYHLAEVLKATSASANALTSILDAQRQEITRSIHNVNMNTKNNQPTINVGGINITCPGVTSQEVMKQVGASLDHYFNGISLDAMQFSMTR